jgi:hypothetical protein
MSRRTSLRAEPSSQVFAGSRTVPEDKVPGHRPEASKIAGHTFKTGVLARAARRVRFPSASATSSFGIPGIISETSKVAKTGHLQTFCKHPLRPPHS